MRITISFFILLFVASLPLHAAIEVYQFSEPAQEKLYKQLTQELRCLVCQNETLAASHAALARDLRQQTYKMVMQGKTYEQIEAYMTQRYGDFVLYRPPLKASTILLWFGPVLLLITGFVVFIRTLRNNDKETEIQLSEAEHNQLRELLMQGEKK